MPKDTHINIDIKKAQINPLIMCFIIGLPLEIIIELLSRSSVKSLVQFVVNEPFAFIYNTLIIAFTLSISIPFKRKAFIYTIVTAVWLTLGITNWVLLDFRVIPLSITDFRILKDALSIVTLYLKIYQITLIVFAFLMVGVVLFLLWRKGPRQVTTLKKSLVYCSVMSVCLLFMTNIGIKAQVLSDDFGDLSDAYANSGFAYCFTRTIFDKGISGPDDYSPESVYKILSDIKDNAEKRPLIENVNPNIIFVQLESFIDPKYLKSLTFSENPTPIFSFLKENYSFGFLTVPSIGAGTANTEFEVLTGMNVHYFGAGEYPYYSVLQTQTCESLAYNLREYGYLSHAIHNNDGDFYSRNIVYENLGFDSFTSLEYMSDVEYNTLGWCTDLSLIPAITSALDTSESLDFIFAVSVQAHGKYPYDIFELYPDLSKEKLSEIKWPLIDVYGAEDDKTRFMYEYYISQIREVDNFIGELICEMESRGEPTIIVFYGDHIPALNIVDTDVSEMNLYQTEYVIWDNIGLEKIDLDLTSYMLSSAISTQLGYDCGLITQLHNSFGLSSSKIETLVTEDDNYSDSLLMLQYDMLYGENYSLAGSVYIPSEKYLMGTKSIIITSAVYSSGDLFVYGENFTRFSQVVVDGKHRNTDFINDRTLVVHDINILGGLGTIEVGQYTSGGDLLGLSEPFTNSLD